MAKRERGAGRVHLRQDPTDPERQLQIWWIDYHVDGRRYRESSKSRKKSDALALLKQRMGEHATGQYVGAEAKRLTFEELEAGIIGSYELKGIGPLPGSRPASITSVITLLAGRQLPSLLAPWSSTPLTG